MSSGSLSYWSWSGEEGDNFTCYLDFLSDESDLEDEESLPSLYEKDADRLSLEEPDYSYQSDDEPDFGDGTPDTRTPEPLPAPKAKAKLKKRSSLLTFMMEKAQEWKRGLVRNVSRSRRGAGKELTQQTRLATVCNGKHSAPAKPPSHPEATPSHSKPLPSHLFSNSQNDGSNSSSESILNPKALEQIYKPQHLPGNGVADHVPCISLTNEDGLSEGFSMDTSLSGSNSEHSVNGILSEECLLVDYIYDCAKSTTNIAQTTQLNPLSPNTMRKLVKSMDNLTQSADTGSALSLYKSLVNLCKSEERLEQRTTPDAISLAAKRPASCSLDIIECTSDIDLSMSDIILTRDWNYPPETEGAFSRLHEAGAGTISKARSVSLPNIDDSVIDIPTLADQLASKKQSDAEEERRITGDIEEQLIQSLSELLDSIS